MKIQSQNWNYLSFKFFQIALFFARFTNMGSCRGLCPLQLPVLLAVVCRVQGINKIYGKGNSLLHLKNVWAAAHWYFVLLETKSFMQRKMRKIKCNNFALVRKFLYTDSSYRFSGVSQEILWKLFEFGKLFHKEIKKNLSFLCSII